MISNKFKCLSCEMVNDHRYNHVNKSLLTCPDCGGEDLQVLLSPPNLGTLNTRDRIQDAVKKRSIDDHQKHKSDRYDRAKEKHKGFL